MSLNKVLASIRSQIGDNIKVKRITSGLTNAVYQLSAHDQIWALRINNPDSTQFGINREREFKILEAIGQFTWAPEILKCTLDLCLSRWVSGAPFLVESTVQLEQLASLLTQVHQIPFTSDNPRDQLLVTEQIANLLNQTGNADTEFKKMVINKCDDYSAPTKLVICHHDWHSKNIIQDRKTNKLVILDWEYAALGDENVDLACVISGFNLSISQQKYLIANTNMNYEAVMHALCLTEAMSLLWYLARYPQNQRSDEQNAWLKRWSSTSE